MNLKMNESTLEIPNPKKKPNKSQPTYVKKTN